MIENEENQLKQTNQNEKWNYKAEYSKRKT